MNLTKSEYELFISNKKYFYEVNIPITWVFLSSLSYILNDRSELNLTINEEETVKVNERMGWNFAQENDRLYRKKEELESKRLSVLEFRDRIHNT